MNPYDNITKHLIHIADPLKTVHGEGGKTFIFGKVSSVTISSYLSFDLNKNSGLQFVNCNEAYLITCFVNEYGYEQWTEKAINFCGDVDDLLIVISSSGRSENILNGVKTARNDNFKVVGPLSRFV